MQVNIAILVVAYSLRAEKTTASSQSGTAARTNLTTAATQITLVLCLSGWPILVLQMHGVDVQCGC
jgi:hypothetical protein